MTEWGVCFLSDDSVRHPWNGRTARARAVEELWRLRARWEPDRFALVQRDGPNAAWVRFCEYAGMTVRRCQTVDLCDCFEHEDVRATLS